MIIEEFQEQSDRLRARYGEKAYSKDFLDIMWGRVNHWAPGLLTKVVDDTITEHFRPLGLSGLVAAGVKLAGANPKFAAGGGAQELLPTLDCANCGGDGLVFLFDPKGYKCVFSCKSCENGRRQFTLASADFERRKARADAGETHGTVFHCAPPEEWAIPRGFTREFHDRHQNNFGSLGGADAR